MTTRKERRANPDQWWRLVELFNQDEERFVEVEGRQINIRGSIDDVIVIRFPADVHPDTWTAMLKGLRATMEGVGLDKPVIIIPPGFEFGKFRPLSAEEGKALDRKARFAKASKPQAGQPLDS